MQQSADSLPGHCLRDVAASKQINGSEGNDDDNEIAFQMLSNATASEKPQPTVFWSTPPKPQVNVSNPMRCTWVPDPPRLRATARATGSRSSTTLRRVAQEMATSANGQYMQQVAGAGLARW